MDSAHRDPQSPRPPKSIPVRYRIETRNRLAAQPMMQVEKVRRIPKRPVAGHTGQASSKVCSAPRVNRDVIYRRRDVCEPIRDRRIGWLRSGRQEPATRCRLATRAFLVAVGGVLFLRFVFGALRRILAAEGRRFGRIGICKGCRRKTHAATAEGRPGCNHDRQITDQRHSNHHAPVYHHTVDNKR